MGSELNHHPSRAERPPLHSVPRRETEPTGEPSPVYRAMSRRLAHGWLLRVLAAEVGGVEVLDVLDDSPLLPEPFDWTGIDAADRPFVEPVLAVIQVIGTGGPGLTLADLGMSREEHRARFLATELDTEDRVIAQRILARVARNRPSVLRRGDPVRAAIALVWLVLDASMRLVNRRDMTGERALTPEALWWATGVTSCVDRGRTLRAAAQCSTDLGRFSRRHDRADIGLPDSWLADASLMRSSTRRFVIETRERLIDEFLDDEQRAATAQRLGRPNGVRAPSERRAIRPERAVRTFTARGDSLVLLTVVEDDLPYATEEELTLTVADAQRLIGMLDAVLDGEDDEPFGRYRRW